MSVALPPAIQAHPVPPETLSKGLLPALGIFGWERLEPVILAALATEAPLLLIGPHGTAKSLLLNTLAAALGLEHRHYNASLLNYDDLVGYPFPNEDKSALRFIETPASIWKAESIFLDEISRCRPDLQNKLFPIIHERVVQGIPLTRLRHRWAAMNPPKLENDFSAECAVEEGYSGSEPLDRALADRFPFVVEVPSFANFTRADRRAVIGGQVALVNETSATTLKGRLDLLLRVLPIVREDFGDAATDYVETILPLLAKLGLGISPRRAAFLRSGILAVHAAAWSNDAEVDPGDSAWLALRFGLPNQAWGATVDEVKLLAAHRQAWALTKVPVGDLERIIQSEPDPVRRVALGTNLGVGGARLSTLVLDALASLNPGRRLTFAAAAFPVLSQRGNLSAAACEALGQLQVQLENSQEHTQVLTPGCTQFHLWQKTTHAVASLDAKHPATAILTNLIYVIFESWDPDKHASYEPSSVVEQWREFSSLFQEQAGS